MILPLSDVELSLLTRIDRKMSNAHTNYKVDEAQAIMSELRTIKKAIWTGEKERRDLMQVEGLARLLSAPACLLETAPRALVLVLLIYGGMCVE